MFTPAKYALFIFQLRATVLEVQKMSRRCDRTNYNLCLLRVLQKRPVKASVREARLRQSSKYVYFLFQISQTNENKEKNKNFQLRTSHKHFMCTTNNMQDSHPNCDKTFPPTVKQKHITMNHTWEETKQKKGRRSHFSQTHPKGEQFEYFCSTGFFST